MTKSLIVLIEDEPAIADTLVYALESDGFEVEWFCTGHDFLNNLSRFSFSAVILDVGLPDISGFELCRRLRKITDVPLIFLTARGDEIDRVAGLEMGADDYVVKPFSPREVVARVRVILRRSAVPASSVSAQSLSIDEAAANISLQGQYLDCSRYEYCLLKYLFEHPNQVLSREQLLLAVWDHPEHVTDRTVDTHIKQLRAKIKKIDADHDWIQTRRGMGYVFVPR